VVRASVAVEDGVAFGVVNAAVDVVDVWEATADSRATVLVRD